MIFLVQLNFEGNLYSKYLVKVFLVGIKWRLDAVPQAYEFNSNG